VKPYVKPYVKPNVNDRVKPYVKQYVNDRVKPPPRREAVRERPREANSLHTEGDPLDL
jgi:hypothetical protein